MIDTWTSPRRKTTEHTLPPPRCRKQPKRAEGRTKGENSSRRLVDQVDVHIECGAFQIQSRRPPPAEPCFVHPSHSHFVCAMKLREQLCLAVLCARAHLCEVYGRHAIMAGLFMHILDTVCYHLWSPTVWESCNKKNTQPPSRSAGSILDKQRTEQSTFPHSPLTPSGFRPLLQAMPFVPTRLPSNGQPLGLLCPLFPLVESALPMGRRLEV